MWFLQAPAAVLGLAALSLLPSAAAKPYPVHVDEPRGLDNGTQLEKRCDGVTCGYYNQLCCTNGDQCYIDANNQAQCGKPQGQGGGSWQYWTSTWVATDLVTRTQVYSTYVGVATPQATATCSQWQNPCGGICCESGYYCLKAGVCQLVGGGSSGGIIGTLTPSAPLRPTSSTLIIVTATGSPTATVPFSTPIPTGVNGTLVEQNGGGGGLSGGAIAGIVIGVILGLLLLLLICFYCCAKSAFDAILACFGIGKKRKHTHEETYIEEHHHSSGGGGRTWYGARPSRPNRPGKSGGGFGNALGIGAALGGLALALGMKRKHDKRHDEKTNTSYTGSSAYYSDYTSSSSASSDDRRSRPTRHSSRR